MRHTEGLSVYRVRQKLSYRHPDRHVRPAWYGRTWQAEWNPCPWCPRAWTEAGVRRKAARWQRRGFAWQLRNARRLAWLRMHVTRRRDDYYATQRRKAKADRAFR